VRPRLIIRDAQLEALRAHAFESFARQALPVVRTAWPRVLADWPDADVLALIARAGQRAARYDITEGPEVIRYLNLMIACGEEFDEDPSYARLTRILADLASAAAVRMRRAARAARRRH
jgi:hypothetical protein